MDSIMNGSFIFYQNILSIHQSAFIRNLAAHHSVILVVPEELDEERAKHGWIVPDFGKTEIVINPAENQLYQLLNKQDAIHVFSGIDSFALLAKAFKIAVKNKLKTGVILEPFNWMGWKGKLRFLKYWMLKMKYNHHIDFILAIGNRGRWCYEKVGFDRNKILDWGYFTEQIRESIVTDNKQRVLSAIFVGSIDTRKNILSLIDVFLSIPDKSVKLNIIGTGPLEKDLKEKIANNNSVFFIGQVANSQVSNYISNSDFLILPSIFDGWGAVVNEALMCGVPVIASDNCSASVLLDNRTRGFVFSVKKNNLKEVLVDFLNELPYSIEKRQKIKNWALESISGEAAANYFVRICEYLYDHKGDRPVAPWLKDIQ